VIFKRTTMNPRNSAGRYLQRLNMEWFRGMAPGSLIVYRIDAKKNGGGPTWEETWTILPLSKLRCLSKRISKRRVYDSIAYPEDLVIQDEREDDGQ
jgi:hypothetical protein